MANVDIKILNPAGTISKKEIKNVANGTKWKIKDNELTIGDEIIKAIPADGWKFEGNWGQKENEGTITNDIVFSANYVNDEPIVGRVYEFVNLANVNYEIDVYGASIEEKARLVLYLRNDSVAQKFAIFASEVEGHSDWKMIVNQNNWRCFWADSSSGQLQNQPILLHNPPIITGEHDWSVDWFFNKETKKVTINGTAYNSFNIPWLKNSNYRIDNAGNQIVEINSIVLYEANGSDAQSWIPVPSAFVMEDWAIPRITLEGKLESVLNSQKTISIMLKGAQTYQMRWRKRHLKHNSNTWDSWTDYVSPSGTKSAWGWGSPWSPTIADKSSFFIECANSNDGYDSTQYEIDVRQFGKGRENYPAVSRTNTLVFNTKQSVKCTLNNVLISADGMVLSFDTDLYRTCDQINLIISSIKLSGKTIYREGNLAFDIEKKQVTIPLEQLSTIPETGQNVTVSYKIDPISNYIAGADTTRVVPVSYSGGSATVIITDLKRTDYRLQVRLAVQGGERITESKVCMVYELNGRMHTYNVPSSSYTTYNIPVLLNKEFNIIATAKTASSWGAAFNRYLFNTSGCVFNTEEEQIAFKFSSEDYLNQFSRHTDLGRENHKLEGKPFPVVSYSATKEIPLVVKGALFNVEDSEKVYSVLNSGICLFRNSRGFFATVSINNIEQRDTLIEDEKALDINMDVVSYDSKGSFYLE